MFDISKELRQKDEAAREALAKALAHFKRVSNPRSVEVARAAYITARENVEAVAAEIAAERLAAVRALSDADLAKRFASARNYSYEATMGDYSMESISRATGQVQDALTVIEERGLDPEKLTSYVAGHGWRAVEEAGK